MKKRTLIKLIILSALAILTATGLQGILPASAISSHRHPKPFYWQCFRGNEQNTGFHPHRTGPDKACLCWKVKTLNEVMSSPAFFQNGHIIIGTHDPAVYLLDKEGKVLDRLKTGEPVISTAAVQGDRAWIGSMDGYLYCVELSGPAQNRLKLIYRVKISDWLVSSPKLYDNLILIASREGYLFGVEKTKGRIKWKTEIGSQQYEVQSSPVVKDGFIFIGSGAGKLLCINGNGKILWTFNTEGPVFSSPAAGPDRSIYFGDQAGFFYAVKDGKLLWRYRAKGSIISSACLTGDGYAVFADKKGFIHKISLKSGRPLWITNGGAPVESSPITGKDGKIFIGTDGNKMLALSKDGKILWKYKTGGPVLSSPAIDDRNRLVFGCEDRYIYCIGPDSVSR